MAGVIEGRIHPWLARFGVDRRTLRRGIATLSSGWAGRVAPDAHEAGLEILAEWVCWAFVVDDQYIDSGPGASRPDLFNPMAARMLACLANPEAPVLDGSPFSAALADLSQRLRAIAPPALIQPWIQAHYMWLFGSGCSVSDRSTGAVRGLDEHLLIGPLDRAEPVTTFMIQMVEGTTLPARELDRAEVRAITDAAHVLETCYNDIASYRHELYQGCLESNLVHVLHIERGGSAQDAMNAAVALVERIMRLFLALCEQIEPTASPELRRYMAQLRHKVRGNSDWQRTVPRYTVHLDIAPDDIVGTPDRDLSIPAATPLYVYTDTPSDAPLTAPAAAITWWWDLLDRTGTGRRPPRTTIGHPTRRTPR